MGELSDTFWPRARGRPGRREALPFYLGIDGGGTKTEAVLIDAAGVEVARATSGPANLHTVGAQVAEASLREAVDLTLSAAGLSLSEVTAVGLGLAGVARPDDRTIARSILSRVVPLDRAVLTHDAEVALVGGIGRRHGIVLIAGTGAIAYGVNAEGRSQRADGWGYLLGDEGSAYWIGRAGLRAVMSAYDGRGPRTALEGVLLAELDVADASVLVNRVYGAAFGVPDVAALAPLVRQCAREGDGVAEDILREAGRRLAHTLSAVIHGLDMREESFEVVLTGGLFRVVDLLWDGVANATCQTAPRARVIEPRHDAAYGAALLARERG